MPGGNSRFSFKCFISSQIFPSPLPLGYITSQLSRDCSLAVKSDRKHEYTPLE